MLAVMVTGELEGVNCGGLEELRQQVAAHWNRAPTLPRVQLYLLLGPTARDADGQGRPRPWHWTFAAQSDYLVLLNIRSTIRPDFIARLAAGVAEASSFETPIYFPTETLYGHGVTVSDPRGLAVHRNPVLDRAAHQVGQVATLTHALSGVQEPMLVTRAPTYAGSAGGACSVPGWEMTAFYGPSARDEVEVTATVRDLFMAGGALSSVLIPSLTVLNDVFGDTRPNTRKRLRISYRRGTEVQHLTLTETSARNEHSYFCLRPGATLEDGRQLVEWDTDLARFLEEHPGSVIPAFWFRRETNFGDMLTPHILTRLAGRQVVFCPMTAKVPKLVVTGSILDNHISPAIVWGAGIARRNDVIKTDGRFLCVRGPLAAEMLQRQRGIRVSVLGDPGLLVARLFPELSQVACKPNLVGYAPHMVDQHQFARVDQTEVSVVDLRLPVGNVLKGLKECRVVFSSSLHGLICTHALGIPAQWILLSDRVHGDHMKFLDFYASVGACCGKHLPGDVCDCLTCSRSRLCVPLDLRTRSVSEVLETCKLISPAPMPIPDGLLDRLQDSFPID